MPLPKRKKRTMAFTSRPRTGPKQKPRQPVSRRPPPKPRQTGGDRFVARYNQRLGRQTGRVIRPMDRSEPARQQRKQTMKSGQKMRGASIALGTSKLPASVKKSREAWFGNTSALTTGGQIEDNLGQIYDELTAKFQSDLQESAAITNEYYEGKTPPEPGGLAGFGKDVMDVAAVLPGVPEAEKFAGSPIGRALDVMSRPAYGLFEGLRNVAEESYNRAETPEEEKDNAWWKQGLLSGLTDWGDERIHDVNALASGAWEGLTGKRKTGFGNVYEEMKNRSANVAGTGLRKLEKEHPAVEQTIARTVGTLGELTLDPADKLGLGRVGVFGRGLANAGAEVTEHTMRDFTLATAKHAAEDYYDDVYHPKFGNLPRAIGRDEFIDSGQINALDRLAASELSIRGGGGARGHGYSTMNGPLWGGTVANAVVEGQRAVVLREFNKHADTFWSRINSGRPLVAGAVQAYMRADPDFSDYIDNLDDALVKAGDLPANSSLDDLINVVSTKPRSSKIVREAEDAVRAAYDPDLAKVYNDVYSTARNASYKTLAIRVGSKKIPVKATGRAYNFVAHKIRGNKIDELSDLSYEKLFPSVLALKAQRVRSVGANAFDAFKKDMQKIARQYTNDEAKIIHDAIENNKDLSHDLHLQAGKDEVMRAYKDMWDEEIAMGARPPGQTFMQNYVFIYNKKGKLKDRTKFKTDRKNFVQSHGTPGPSTMAEARRLGLKPVENAFEAVMYRKLKSQRDLTRAMYLADMVENYGFHAQKISGAAQHGRKITKVNTNNLPQHMRQEVLDHGGEYYLPTLHAENVKYFDDLTRWNSASMGRFMREWNKVIGVIKSMLTIPAPGFHMTNMVGDTFMGLMDGVRADMYANVLKKLGQAKAGMPANVKIVPGYELDIRELWSMYQKDAAGGYYHIDIGNYVHPSTKNVAGRSARRVRDTAIDLSEAREDFGRFTHYIHAYKDEIQKAYRPGMTVDAMERIGRDSALWRVNYYRFDYNALTLWERKMKTIGVPFYTYARKVIPVLLASMFENPKYINLTNRFMTYNDGSAADAFSNWDVPDYLRFGGGAFLNNNEEPLFANMNMLPMGNLNLLQPGGTMNPLNPDFWSGASQKGLQYLNPPMQLPIELGTKTEAFTGQRIDDPFQHILNKLPLVKDIRTEGNEVPGLNRLIPGEDQPFNPQGLLYNRLFGAGQNIRPITRGQQEFARNEWVDQLIEDPLSSINRSQDLFSVYADNTPRPGGQMQFEVRSKMQLDESGQPAVIRVFNTAQEAIDFVKQNLPQGYQEQDRTLSRQLSPTGQAYYRNMAQP